MYDLAIFLCCLNNFRIYCLEYSCLIISLLLFSLNLLGIIIINWNLISFYVEVLYSINISICVFLIFLISIIIYSTKNGKITSNEFYKNFSSISLMAIFIYIYLLLTYSLSSYKIIYDYWKFKKFKCDNNLSNIEQKKIKQFLNLKLAWILLFISAIIPIILSIINILIWTSIYYRIIFQIYCSFNKEIRKELRTQKKQNREFHELNETNSINTNNKRQIKEPLKHIVSVIMEKDRHPASIKSNSNGIFKNNQNRSQQINRSEEFAQSDANSSQRNFDKSNNQT